MKNTILINKRGLRQYLYINYILHHTSKKTLDICWTDKISDDLGGIRGSYFNKTDWRLNNQNIDEACGWIEGIVEIDKGLYITKDINDKFKGLYNNYNLIENFSKNTTSHFYNSILSLQLNELPKLGNIKTKFTTNPSKFKHINDLSFTTVEKMKFNSKSDNVIVYCVHHDLIYAKFTYLSLLTLYNNTDASNFDLKIVCSKHLLPAIKLLFKNILDESCIIPNSGGSFKYNIFNLDDIKVKKKVCMMDADGFLIGKNKIKFFHSFFSKDFDVIMKEVGLDVKETINDRRYILGEDPQIKEDLLKLEKWHLAGISFYNMKHFKSFSKFSKKYISDRVSDDEAVIQLYCMVNKIHIKDFGNSLIWVLGCDLFFYKPTNNISFVHPFVGNVPENDKYNDFLKNILKIKTNL